jgi:serine/threonine protein kinase
MISYDRLIDLTKLGRGEFGEVLVGLLECNAPTSNGKVPQQHHEVEKRNGTDVNEIQAQQLHTHVLVKSLSKIKDESYFIEFRRQIDLYRAVDSLNVVKLLALCFERDHHFMVLEHSQDLRGYLAEHRGESIETLLKFSRHIAFGFNAIAKSNLVHR